MCHAPCSLVALHSLSSFFLFFYERTTSRELFKPLSFPQLSSRSAIGSLSTAAFNGVSHNVSETLIVDNCNKTATFPCANRSNETIYPDKTCALNFIPVRITQRTTVNDARRTSNPNNLIYPRSDPSPVNPRPIHRSCHFVPSIILANVMSLLPKIDEIRLYVQDHVPILCALLKHG